MSCGGEPATDAHASSVAAALTPGVTMSGGGRGGSGISDGGKAAKDVDACLTAASTTPPVAMSGDGSGGDGLSGRSEAGIGAGANEAAKYPKRNVSYMNDPIRTPTFEPSLKRFIEMVASFCNWKYSFTFSLHMFLLTILLGEPRFSVEFRPSHEARRKITYVRV